MHKPFAVLEDLVREGRITFANGSASAGSAAASAPESMPGGMPKDMDEVLEFAVDLPEGLRDDELFAHAMKAMHGVRALGWSAAPLHPRPPLEIQPQDGEEEALRVLADFLRNGSIEIEHTTEYIEGTARPEGRLYLADLRSGRFSVQAHLDLHGMNQQEARFALDEFILASVRTQFSCVRIIHGRGRHSHKQQPILKDSIQRWLASRRIGRHVLAYTSARQCDGGGGAVYVLLRA